MHDEGVEGRRQQQHEQVVQHQCAQANNCELRKLHSNLLVRLMSIRPAPMEHEIVDSARGVRDRVCCEGGYSEQGMQHGKERDVNQRSQCSNGQESPEAAQCVVSFKRVDKMSHVVEPFSNNEKREDVHYLNVTLRTPTQNVIRFRLDPAIHSPQEYGSRDCGLTSWVGGDDALFAHADLNHTCCQRTIAGISNDHDLYTG